MSTGNTDVDGAEENTAETMPVEGIIGEVGKKTEKPVFVKKFQQHWLQMYPWLRYDDEKNMMWCQTCRDANRNNSMSIGIGQNFQTSTLARHVESQDHRFSLQVGLNVLQFLVYQFMLDV